MKTSIDQFDFALPEELIAQYPADRRDASRLLVADRNEQTITDSVFSSITDYLDERHLLVVNNTKVLRARFLAQKATGGAAEVFMVRPAPDGRFVALTKGKNLKPGTTVFAGDCPIVIDERLDDGTALVRFPENDPYEAMDRFGHIPLPPYIRREDGAVDDNRYQTVYAKNPGSVAAPTAGLHFTDEIMQTLRNKGVSIVEVTLDVGLGTFQPVKADHLEDHIMHKEFCRVDTHTADTINTHVQNGKKLIAVGTTSVRTLESAADQNGRIIAGSYETDLFIRPGYRFKAVQGMVTNFHLPKSTLFVLVSTFSGQDFMQKAYAHAVQEKYRFFSYGDAMLLL